MVDYSRFDKIDCGPDSDGESAPIPKPMSPSSQEPPEQGASSDGRTRGRQTQEAAFGLRQITPSKKGKEGRIKFEYEGRTVYEWEQSLEEVNIYITPPPGITAGMIDCKIEHRHIRLGLKGAPPFLDENAWGAIKAAESFWMMDEDGEININLQKVAKGQTWGAALRGREGRGGLQAAEVDPITRQNMQKQILLERFQEENPSFDFSNADFNGMVPDAQTFMGGVRYS